MLTVAHSDLVTEVRVLMGYKPASAEDASPEGVPTVDSYIEELLPAAVAMCSTVSVSGGVNVGFVRNVTSAAAIGLPADYVRLLMVTLDGEKPAVRVHANASPVGAAQWNAYARSHRDNLSVVQYSSSMIGIWPAGRNVTLFYEKKYSSLYGLHTSSVRYRHGVCAMAASLVYEAFHEYEKADRMKRIAGELIA